MVSFKINVKLNSWEILWINEESSRVSSLNTVNVSFCIFLALHNCFACTSLRLTGLSDHLVVAITTIPLYNLVSIKNKKKRFEIPSPIRSFVIGVMSNNSRKIMGFMFPTNDTQIL